MFIKKKYYIQNYWLIDIKCEMINKIINDISIKPKNNRKDIMLYTFLSKFAKRVIKVSYWIYI